MATVYDIDDSSNDSTTNPASGLRMVYLSSEAFHFCMNQSLSTEVEEIMGLLIGELDEGKGICRVTHCLPLKRLDKRKDRVEIGTEQLVKAFDVVEDLNKQRRDHKAQYLALNDGDGNFDRSGIPLQCVGWYHSHPHITVFPSDVDIATHHQYQATMSQHWLGLIFGVFNYEESSCTNKFQLIAFQSSCGGLVGGSRLQHVVIPIEIDIRPYPEIDRWAVKKMATLIDLLVDEEREAFFLNQGDQKVPGEDLGRHYNVCVYSKAIAKIVTLLGAPMSDSLDALRTYITRYTQVVKKRLEK